jgi:hypothetical protein
MPTISQDILQAALHGLQLEKQRIDSSIAEVQSMLNGGSRKTTLEGTALSASEEAPRNGTRKRSAAVRKRIAEAQRARWAAIKGTSEPPSTTTSEATPGKRKKFSTAARKRMALAQKARWAKAKG